MLKNLQWISQKYLSNYMGLPWVCWQLIGISFINSISGSLSFFLSIYFVSQLHLSVAVSGLIISFYGLGTVIGGMAGGWLADRVSPGVLSSIGLAIKALIIFSLIYENYFFMLIFLLFLYGVATYVFITANNLCVLNFCQDQEHQRLQALNILYVAANVGMGLAGLLIGVLAVHGFKIVFIATALFLILAALFQLFLERKSIVKINISSANAAKQESASSRLNNLEKKLLSAVLICVFFVGFFVAQVGTTYSIYIRDSFPALGVNSFAWLFSLNSVIIVFLQTPFVNFFQKYNKMLTLGVGAFLMGFGMFLLNFLFAYWFAIVAFIFYTLGEMLFFSNAQLITYQLGAAKKKGQSLGLFQAVFAFGVVVGPALGSYIYHLLGSHALWSLLGVLAAGSLGMCLALKEKYWQRFKSE